MCDASLVRAAAAVATEPLSGTASAQWDHLLAVGSDGPLQFTITAEARAAGAGVWGFHAAPHASVVLQDEAVLTGDVQDLF